MPADQDTEKLIAEIKRRAKEAYGNDIKEPYPSIENSTILWLAYRLADALASSPPASNCPACNPSSAGEVGVIPQEPIVDPMMLDSSGRCCGRKPMVYKRPPTSVLP